MIQKSPLDLPDIVNTVITKLKPKIQKKHILLQFNPPAENIPINGHEVLLSQLFYNLVDNAIKYTPEHGHVWVTMENKKQNVIIIIRDSGIGIPVQFQEKIFERFYRIDNSRTQTKGFGLGLAIGKAIVEKHLGEIAISSKEGKGTTFIVTLPYV